MTILVDDLIEQIRDQIDEDDEDNISDSQIIRVMNSAQRQGANILSRKFEDMLWESTSTTTDGTSDLDIPTGAYGSRVQLVELELSDGRRRELRRISNSRKTKFNTSTSTTRPTHYTIKRNKIELLPLPASGLTIHMHYFQKPNELVISQGRIKSVSVGSTYVEVDAIGSGLSTNSANFSAYVNIIDFNTGNVKRSLQINSLDTIQNLIYFKTTGLTRSTVLNKTISTSIPTTVAADDYVCLVSGTCIPEIDGAYLDFIIQHSTVALKRRVGEPTEEDRAELKKIEDELLLAWANRPGISKVRTDSPIWSRSVRWNHRGR